MPELDVVDDNNEETQGGIPPTLDQVHQMSQNKVSDDEEEVEEVNDETDDLDETDDTTDEVEDVDEADEEDEEVEEQVEEVEKLFKPELNEDITTKGEGKVAIRDNEGNTLYFNSLDEVPDTFEPLSYKELMKGVSALNRKEDLDAKLAIDEQAAHETREAKERSDALQKSWENDAKKLTKEGFLPKGDKNEAALNEVYDYMEQEMKQGNIITSFTQAYKSLQYDKQAAEQKQKQKDVNDAKKQRGGIVQGGSGGDVHQSAQKGKVFEAPPSGTSLDAVHRRALGQM